MSTNTNAEKSTSRRRVSVVVVLAQSRSALPVATMSMRSATVPTSQRVRNSGSPTARPISAITRRQRSIANPAGSPFAATLENGGESPEKATRISLADLMRSSVRDAPGGTAWANASEDTVTRTSSETS